MDDERSAALATEKLIELGHRRIGFIAGPGDYSLSGWRVAGWRSAMEFAGLQTEGLCEEGDFGYDSGENATRALLHPNRPSAIIASNDQMALAALEVARELGLNVFSLVSFDNTPIVRFTNPPLAAVDQPIAQTISRAVELLINAAKAPLPSDPINIEGSLQLRGSVGPAPGANDL